MNISKELKGIFQAIFSAILFGLMPLFTKVIYSFGSNFTSTAFYRTSLSLILVFILCILEDKSIRINFKEFIYLIIGSIFFVATSLTLYSSYNYISSGVATTIHFAYPIIIFIINTIISKSRPNKIDVFCILSVSLGLVLIIDLKSGHIDLRGVVLAAISSFTYSFYSIFLERSVLKNLNSIRILFYINLISSFLIFVFVHITGNKIVLSYNLFQWMFIFLYSIVITIGATLLYQKSLRNIGATYTSILSCLEPVTSVVFGILLLSELIFFKQVLAIILILSSTIIIVINQIKKYKIN
ncbi:EamA family transporter [Peptoniphilus sp. AGMB00490]|uniref:EamA family transporter n=1 Tax=Peptoniphilus faecalis TaxID=2731255 RepID=A0A848RP94_9FIRM|nr:DMT family transporter [Peptoniphilus faecalis]NMW86092.1 EamA family transporter [Peptoniphilus faecalis]